jgi:hypothetical protein
LLLDTQALGGGGRAAAIVMELDLIGSMSLMEVEHSQFGVGN